MAERYISIDNVIGSGTNGKVMLSDLDLSQDDLARFSSLLTSYIKSGDFAADLTSPDWFSSGPSNYNIIPYFDSFENYIDKQILGPVSPNIDSMIVSGTNFRAYNGSVSAKVECNIDGATKYLHADTNTSDAWITVGTGATGENHYRFSGYFWFTGPNAGVKLEVINQTTLDSDFAGAIEISSDEINNGTNRWTRFISDKFYLNTEDLITFKLTVNLLNDEPTVFYMDALQLEVVVGETNEIKSFIQSGVVITDGSNIRVNSLTAKAIKALTITTNKLAPEVGSELNISGNTTIVAERTINNILPWTADEFTNGFFEQGTIDASGINQDSEFYIRSNSVGFLVQPNSDYIVSLSTDLINNYSKIFFYTIDNVLIGSPTTITTQNVFINSGSAAHHARLTLAKDNLSYFDPTQINNYYGRVESAESYLSGAKYRFDGTNATFTNGGLIIRKQTGPSTYENVFSADVNGNLTIKAELNAATGSFSGNITSGATITGAVIKGGSITAGNLIDGAADVVKMTSDGLWAGASTFNSGKFKVNTSGTLTAINADISGKITSTDGKIGGWTISSSTISSGGIILDSTNRQIKFNDGAYLYGYNLTNTISVSGDFQVTNGLLYLNKDNYGMTVRGYNVDVYRNNPYGVVPLYVNGSPVITTDSRTDSTTRGPIRAWLSEDGVTLYIRTD